jgi:hypothetical protein
MEILGIGTDIIECPRIGKMIEQHGGCSSAECTPRRDPLLPRAEACHRALRRPLGVGSDPQGVGPARSRYRLDEHRGPPNGQDGRPACLGLRRGTHRQGARHRRHPDLDLALPHLRYRLRDFMGRPKSVASPRRRSITTWCRVTGAWRARLNRRPRLSGDIGYHGHAVRMRAVHPIPKGAIMLLRGHHRGSTPFFFAIVALMTTDGRSGRRFGSRSIPIYGTWTALTRGLSVRDSLRRLR